MLEYIAQLFDIFNQSSEYIGARLGIAAIEVKIWFAAFFLSLLGLILSAISFFHMTMEATEKIIPIIYQNSKTPPRT